MSDGETVVRRFSTYTRSMTEIELRPAQQMVN